MDTAKLERSAEAAEAQLERFITQRHEKRVAHEGERLEEDLWMETVKAYNERERQGILWERLRYHEALIQSHSSTLELLIGRHRDEVERLERLLGIAELDQAESSGATAA
jgi:hypothetical protein